MEKYSTETRLVGIDIGKNVNEVGVYNGDTLERIGPTVQVGHNREGLGQVQAVVDELLGAGYRVKMGNEPTGVYYENWTRELRAGCGEALARGQMSYELVPPRLVKEARVGLQAGRSRKSDRIDTEAIAQCLRLGQGIPIRLAGVAEVGNRLWGERYRSAVQSKRALQISLMTQVDRLWPGALVNVARFKRAHPGVEPPEPLVESRPLERRLVQVLLTHYPNPYTALDMSESQLQAALRQYMPTGLATVRKVIRNVRQAILPPRDIADLYVQRLQEDWAIWQIHQERIERLEVEAEAVVLDTPAAVLTSIPGLTPAYAIRYLGAIQRVSDFADADKIWSFAGFDPILNSSGDRERWGPISRKGDPAFRETLFLIGQSLARHCPPIRQAFQRCYDPRAKNHILATLHAAHKANRLIYRLLVTQQPYQAE